MGFTHDHISNAFGNTLDHVDDLNEKIKILKGIRTYIIETVRPQDADLASVMEDDVDEVINHALNTKDEVYTAWECENYHYTGAGTNDPNGRMIYVGDMI